ncbi:Nucleoporin nup35 [Tieghemiomyces parasiticus]|uniref:Nucleoporin nup35 n=1 Tax=Tieghemiomyces parasiticus TaxID=78921 RepID=A0A9W8ABW3_9FUNG|nr:Nucleoporin nup35 [Tieghemiomyces parasiticus]
MYQSPHGPLFGQTRSTDVGASTNGPAPANLFGATNQPSTAGAYGNAAISWQLGGSAAPAPASNYQMELQARPGHSGLLSSPDAGRHGTAPGHPSPAANHRHSLGLDHATTSAAATNYLPSFLLGNLQNQVAMNGLSGSPYAPRQPGERYDPLPRQPTPDRSQTPAVFSPGGSGTNLSSLAWSSSSPAKSLDPQVQAYVQSQGGQPSLTRRLSGGSGFGHYDMLNSRQKKRHIPMDVVTVVGDVPPAATLDDLTQAADSHERNLHQMQTNDADDVFHESTGYALPGQTSQPGQTPATLPYGAEPALTYGWGSTTSAGTVNASTSWGQSVGTATAPPSGFTVTVFGFPPDLARDVFEYFRQFGEITSYGVSEKAANFITFVYARGEDAQRALGCNGKVIGSNVMVGVVPGTSAVGSNGSTMNNSAASAPAQTAAAPVHNLANLTGGLFRTFTSTISPKSTTTAFGTTGLSGPILPANSAPSASSVAPPQPVFYSVPPEVRYSTQVPSSFLRSGPLATWGTQATSTATTSSGASTCTQANQTNGILTTQPSAWQPTPSFLSSPSVAVPQGYHPPAAPQPSNSINRAPTSLLGPTASPWMTMTTSPPTSAAAPSFVSPLGLASQPQAASTTFDDAPPVLSFARQDHPAGPRQSGYGPPLFGSPPQASAQTRFQSSLAATDRLSAPRAPPPPSVLRQQQLRQPGQKLQSGFAPPTASATAPGGPVNLTPNRGQPVPIVGRNINEKNANSPRSGAWQSAMDALFGW